MKVFLTNRCNLKCVYCFKDKRKKEPTFDEIISQINKAKKVVLLRGGEALIREDILKILRYAKSRKLKIELETNAYYLTKEILNLIDEIHLVFDSINFHDWQKTTRSTKKVYNKSLKNIKIAVKAGKKIYLNTLLTTINLNSLAETKKFCDDNGIILRIFENPPVKGFEESNVRPSDICHQSKPKIMTKERLRYRKNK